MKFFDIVQNSQKKYYIDDYKKSNFLVPKIDIFFDIQESYTYVTAKYLIKPIISSWVSSSNRAQPLSDMILNGDHSLHLESIKCNNNDVPHSFQIDGSDKNMIIDKNTIENLLNGQSSFLLTIKCKIDPKSNKSSQGLYISDNDIYYTKCEPEGFRKIIYSFDRPDILSIWTVTITVDPLIINNNFSRPAVLLSNGNLIQSGKNKVTWYDPHPKPSYLFALIVGSLGYKEDTYFKNNSFLLNNKVTIRIYAHHDKISLLDHAIQSVKKAMKWDEDNFGLYYDLNVYNIVSLDDFNKGGTESKGVNVINSLHVLTSPQTTTDEEYENSTKIIGHEYFHNWTGNRVIIENWFDLTIKEGLTTYREQRFASDVCLSKINTLIERVIDLRSEQFLEDNGPNAHPIIPSSYRALNNLYTPTIYKKGAEIVRIYETLLGTDGFKKGMDLYFKRHDGTAVSYHTFWNAMMDANIPLAKEDRLNFTLSMKGLYNWYGQSGTPLITIKYNYN